MRVALEVRGSIGCILLVRGWERFGCRGQKRQIEQERRRIETFGEGETERKEVKKLCEGLEMGKVVTSRLVEGTKQQ